MLLSAQKLDDFPTKSLNGAIAAHSQVNHFLLRKSIHHRNGFNEPPASVCFPVQGQEEGVDGQASALQPCGQGRFQQHLAEGITKVQFLDLEMKILVDPVKRDERYLVGKRIHQGGADCLNAGGVGDRESKKLGSMRT